MHTPLPAVRNEAPDAPPDLAIVWGAILLFDVAVFAFTLNRMRSGARQWRGSLLNLMLRDGAHPAR